MYIGIMTKEEFYQYKIIENPKDQLNKYKFEIQHKTKEILNEKI